MYNFDHLFIIMNTLIKRCSLLNQKLSDGNGGTTDNFGYLLQPLAAELTQRVLRALELDT